jgi:Fe2+ transport system protein B
MALAQEDIEQIQALITKSIQVTPEVGNANVRYELELRERTTRVEEELKHQRELMLAGFAQMDKRFEQVEKRFEQVDKQLEQVDKQLEQMRNESDRRFEQVEKHFEKIDKQFELQSKSIMDIHQEIKLQMRWSFGVLIAVGGLVVGVLRMSS